MSDRGSEMSGNFFKAKAHDGSARLGSYELNGRKVRTPSFFPVVALFCGGTQRTLFAGGIYRHIKSHIKSHPSDFDCIMTSAVQFLDFYYDKRKFDEALSIPIRDWLGFRGMLFVDSGGFKLISSEQSGDHVLAGRGPLNIEMTAGNILGIQQRMGADIVATLDYPLAPGISRRMRNRRIRTTIDNSIIALEQKPSSIRVFAAVHGHTPQGVRKFVSVLRDGFDGYAVGSLVPLKNDYETLIRIVQAARSSVPEEEPVHLFGVTGKLLPLFAYMGVDSFDSATYVLAGMYGRYLIPETRKGKDVGKMPRRTCTCPICSDHSLASMRLHTSESAALISLHNYYVYKNETNELQSAIEQGELDKFITKYCENDRRLNESFKLVKRLCAGDRRKL